MSYTSIIGLNGDITPSAQNGFILEVKYGHFKTKEEAEYFGNNGEIGEEGLSYPLHVESVFIKERMVWIQISNLHKESDEVMRIAWDDIVVRDMESKFAFNDRVALSIICEVSEAHKDGRVLESLYYGVEPDQGTPSEDKFSWLSQPGELNVLKSAAANFAHYCRDVEKWRSKGDSPAGAGCFLGFSGADNSSFVDEFDKDDKRNARFTAVIPLHRILLMEKPLDAFVKTIDSVIIEGSRYFLVIDGIEELFSGRYGEKEGTEEIVSQIFNLEEYLRGKNANGVIGMIAVKDKSVLMQEVPEILRCGRFDWLLFHDGELPLV